MQILENTEVMVLHPVYMKYEFHDMKAVVCSILIWSSHKVELMLTPCEPILIVNS